MKYCIIGTVGTAFFKNENFGIIVAPMINPYQEEEEEIFGLCIEGAAANEAVVILHKGNADECTKMMQHITKQLLDGKQQIDIRSMAETNPAKVLKMIPKVD